MRLFASGRRRFLTRSLPALANAAWVGKPLPGRTDGIRVRVEWQEFRRGSHYAPFVAAFDAMRRNTNAQDPASLDYWAGVHANHCPHSMPYFLAWHRGLLYLFEQCLQRIAGIPDLMLPYWDYYRSSRIPEEFAAPAPGNPLYRERLTTDLHQALSLNPFRDTLVNLPRGMPSSFEAQLEYKPHGPIHNLIGKLMATPQAPADPIFWVHHAQIDRLWAAWTAAGAGRQMPPATDPYWQGSLTYSETLQVERARVIDHHGSLGYRYADESMPVTVPPAQLGYATYTDNAQGLTPPMARTGNIIARLRHLILRGDVLRVRFPVSAKEWNQLMAIAAQRRALPFGKSGHGPEHVPFQSVRLVLDQIDVLGTAADGGFFYDLFLTRHDHADAGDAGAPQLIGGFGPFEINGRQHHHGPRTGLAFAVTAPLLAMAGQMPRHVMLVFVRLNTRHAPQGPAIRIGELRLEFSTEETA